MENKLKLFHREDFQVRAYEVNQQGRVTMLSLFNYMQEAAGNHAAKLGVSVQDLFKKNMTWVLSRVHIQIHDFPFWKQKVVIETWPAEKDTYYAIRDFRIRNEKDELIGIATSSWMMIDLKERKPVMIPEFIDKLKNTEEGRALQDSFGKLPKLENVDSEKVFNVRLSDLDINRHVNSVNFIEWALESVPLDITKTAVLSEIEVTYRAEAHYGDRVISQCQTKLSDDGYRVIHRLLKEGSEKELTRIVTAWSKRKDR